ncbi:O-antigen ligase family protein [Cohnella silvisoli]|uniref:O-antigen ligase family protein n=1 Tax=Cohnella silvisoli TaxID=2873699 RepID=A0ABV1KQ30_9BACL|nr:O-antigen ligase family protein [Cohnella silvisoli]MCD9022367.1 O-antigen ligase family protein [Cohnella silvisoli]
MTKKTIKLFSTNTNEQLAYIVLTSFLWIGAVCAGYFFEVAFLLLDAGLFLVLAVYLWRGRYTPLQMNLWLGSLTAFIGLYWLSCFYAVDSEAAVLEAARFSSLLPLAIFASSLTAAKYDSYLRQSAWAGAFLTVLGWGLELFRDGRLESSIGYANTLAILLVIGVLIAWKAYSENHGKIYLGLLLIQLVGLVQTGSRTVLVLFAGACIVEMFRLRGKALQTGVGIVSLAVATAAATAYFFQVKVMLRFMDISWNAPEFQLRKQYWSDGMALLKEHWIVGLGGGGWAVEHSSWYYVKYLHQFYLQLVLEIGIGGLLTFGMFVLIPLFKTRQMLKITGSTWIMIALLLFHIALDIDFEYPICFGLFIILLSGLESINPLKRVAVTSSHLRSTIIVFCIVITIAMVMLLGFEKEQFLTTEKTNIPNISCA